MKDFKTKMLETASYHQRFNELASVCDAQGIEYRSIIIDGNKRTWKEQFEMLTERFSQAMSEKEKVKKVENSNTVKNNILKTTAAERQKILAQAGKDFLTKQQNRK